MRKRVLLILCLLITVGGCVGPGEFSRRSRTRSFDKLWRTLRTKYVFFGLCGEANRLRDKHRSKVIAAETPHAYLVAMAGMISDMNDRHVYFLNEKEWLEERIGPATSAACEVHCAGGCLWVELKDDAMVQAEGEEPLPEQAWYRLLAVEGVPVHGETFGLLDGKPDEPIAMRILLADYSERDVVVRRKPLPDKVARPAREDAPQSDKKKDDDDKGEAEAEDQGAWHDVRKLTLADGEIGYIRIDNFESKKVVEKFDEALDDLMTTKALVLNLWQNGGGHPYYVMQVLGRFVDVETPYAIQGQRYPQFTHRGFFYDVARAMLRVSPRGRTYRAPIVIMIGPETGSGGEELAVALADLRGADLVGMRTIGAWAATRTVKLPDGLVLRYSGWPLYRLDGRTHQFVGLAPDHAVPLNVQAAEREGEPAFQRWLDDMCNEALDVARARAGLVEQETK